VSDESTFKTMRLDTECGEPGCGRAPTRIAVGVEWRRRRFGVWAFCDEHAKAAMSRARAMKSEEEGLH
jgi:hypothetical protein